MSIVYAACMVGSIDAALRNQVTVTAHNLQQVQKRDWAVTVTFALHGWVD